MCKAKVIYQTSQAGNATMHTWRHPNYYERPYCVVLPGGSYMRDKLGRVRRFVRAESAVTAATKAGYDIG